MRYKAAFVIRSQVRLEISHQHAELLLPLVRLSAEQCTSECSSKTDLTKV